MQNEILINATPGETRVAILEKNQFVELHLERARSRSVVGSVMKGRVTRVLPGMQAAFVDIGLEKAAFLYAGDYVENIERLDEDDDGGGGPRGRRRRRQAPQIETLLREGQEIVVQIAKEPIGTKGARITSHVSVAGRHLVLTPWAQRVGVSRKIDADKERRRLREIVNRVKPADLGFIIRTAGEGTREADLEADVRYLTTVWDDIQIRKDQVRAPAVLYAEPSLPLRVVRDFANPDTKRIVVDSEAAYQEMKDFIDRFVADPKPRLDLFRGPQPLFDEFGIEAQIDANLGKKVWLKSGGYLIVDQSEALTAIDVNTGRYVGKRDLEETVLKTNLEAVREVVHQLRFRNIGGLIIIDLIDMESQENREKVYRALQEAIRGDKAKTNILKISELGLVEMTRKRTRENLVQMLCEPCSYCEGKGYVLSDESVAHKVLREVRKDLPRYASREVAITVSRRVAEQLLTHEKPSLEALEEELGRRIEVRARADLHQEQFEVESLGEGGVVDLALPWLTERPAEEGRGRRGRRRKADAGEPAAEPAAPATEEAPAPAAEGAPAATAADATPTAEATGPAPETAATGPSPEPAAAAADPDTPPAADAGTPTSPATRAATPDEALEAGRALAGEEPPAGGPSAPAAGTGPDEEASQTASPGEEPVGAGGPRDGAEEAPDDGSEADEETPKARHDEALGGFGAAGGDEPGR
ncbi:MAG: Rne/Rng family ribonuclease [Myxococcota bacterium]|nr:Rne/Rng family ribonuclease [Myxococcota bacterium]